MAENEPKSLEAFFQKSNFFRVVHADGCYGGLTPRGSIHCGFYSERVAIPQRTSIPIIDGQPGPETILEGKEGLVRELDVDVVMDFTTAVSFHIWMRDKLETLRVQMQVSDEDWNALLGRAK
ncbi:hypothetical protein [Alsobacter soli]|uniref:hypothetical protein n=1 Tax=Alsobacter soli TaxID=2109933 RepID=UPI0011B1C6A8|nr:hypothetical protein [Alsobacter soli]